MAIEKRVLESSHWDGIDSSALDDRGRLSLPQAVRDALQLRAGALVTFVLLDGTVLLVPGNKDLNDLLERAARSLTQPEQTLEQLLANLPKVREEVMTEAYGEEFMQELKSKYASLLGTEADHTDGE